MKIVQRLRDNRRHTFPDGQVGVRNRDGPEAADLIETLVEAGQRVLNGLNARIDAADPASVPLFDGIAELHAALALARGENTPGSEEMK